MRSANNAPISIIGGAGHRVQIPLEAKYDKALLARMSDEQIEEWIEEAPQPKATKGKLRRRLKDDIAHIRHSGIACDIDDPFEGCAGIACAISTFRGAYAITLLVPSSRMPQKQDALIAALKETRDTVERLVGL